MSTTEIIIPDFMEVKDPQTVQEWLGEDNQIGIDIWERKYRYENESFPEWLNRVSGNNSQLKQLIIEKKFLFGGRILASRGVLDKESYKASLSNCYVIGPPDDNIESIFDSMKKMGRTYSYGGGCGIDISKLAPVGARVRNAAKESSGSISFMPLFSEITKVIANRNRRGALLISISCDHPDLEEFIKIKTDLNNVTKANISIRMNDAFMTAVEEKKPFTLKFTREATGETIEKVIDAYEIFKLIASVNWDYAEPGMLFWDRVENYNMLHMNSDFKYAGVNPCGELVLPAGGACLLGSLNLSAFVNNNGQFEEEEFKYAIRICMIELNKVLDEGLPFHPLQEQRESVRKWRQTGLGIMGLGDMLIKMGITYGSEKSIAVCDAIGWIMANSAIETSIELSYMNGGPYPGYRNNTVNNSSFFQVHADTPELKSKLAQHGIYNSQILTVPPTGSIATMLGISSGIEPVFAKSMDRKTETLKNGEYHYKVYTPIVKEYMESHNLKNEDELPEYFITAREIPYQQRIEMQAVWQNHIDSSISSTINLPESATVEDIMDLYMLAWKKGLKGVTVFREGCKRIPILTAEDKKKDSKSIDTAIKETIPESLEKIDGSIKEKLSSDEMKWIYQFAKGLKDPHEEIVTYHGLVVPTLPRGYIIQANDDCIGKKRTLQTGCGTLHCNAYFDPNTGKLVEVYLSKGSTGGCNNFMIGLSRMISLSARAGVAIEDIIDQLLSCGTCPSYATRRAVKKDTSQGSSCPVAVAYALKQMQKEMIKELADKRFIESCQESFNEKIEVDSDEVDIYKNQSSTYESETCPECGSVLSYESGCMTCRSCGWSKCD